MSPVVAKRLRLLAYFVGALLLLGLGAGGWFYSRLRASLPQLDGASQVTGLSSRVTVERDALGVPTLRGTNRTDLARALGWLHAQERFFQMDLMRRSAAGELSALFGSIALPRDRVTRMHGFRKLAQTVVARLPTEQRAWLEAYVSGVNAGLAALGTKPFEYLVLRGTPDPWLAEDSLLVAYAMTMDLQDPTARYEQTLMTLRDTLGNDAVAFFAPLVGPDDAALDGTTAPLPPIPGPQVLDLRLRGKVTSTLPPLPSADTSYVTDIFPPRDPEAYLGSNAYALSGAHTASGAALLANDPHLDHAVPNTWYRASLEWPGHKVTGVTLPGLFAIIIGSNGHVAWGLTDAYADTGDLVVLQTNPSTPDRYLTPGATQPLAIETRRETIAVKGSAAVTAEYDWSIWGPIVSTDARKNPLAHRWTAYDPAATNFNYLGLEDARTVAEAVAVAHRSGMPAHNFLVADTAGDVAWTITGVLPHRIGYDGRLPTTWTTGDRRWDGLLPPDEFPVVTTKPTGLPTEIISKDGRLWSANQRHIGGAGLAILGDGAYNRAARGAQARDDLSALEKATPKDLLAVQLDDRALLIARWHQLLLATLTPAATADRPARAALRASAEKWDGRASVESTSYRLAREFRDVAQQLIYQAIFAGCRAANPRFSSSQLRLDSATWALLQEKPAHLLNPAYSSWDALLLGAADEVSARLEKQHVSPGQATWGRRNTVTIRHPLSRALPGFLTHWLNMPTAPLPGDEGMPRVQGLTHGASMRLVVSPGREAEGILHMPCGQSGHPLSPYYRAGHEAWVRAEPAPFLPGKTEHTLELKP